LTHFQSRSLAGHLARFISVDPLYVDPESLAGQAGRDFLEQPQRHNLYAFAACNPLKYVDADGLDVQWSPELTRSREFQRALKILESSDEGKRVLAALANANITAGVGKGENDKVAGVAHSSTELQGSERRGYRRVVSVAIEIDIAKARKDHTTDAELANIIHHELRHAEIHTEEIPGEDLEGVVTKLTWLAKVRSRAWISMKLLLVDRVDHPLGPKGTGVISV